MGLIVEVLDVHDRQFWPPADGDAGRFAVMHWLQDHGIDGATVIRLELHIIDCPVLRIFGLAVNGEGKHYTVPGNDGEPEIAYAPPRDVLMRSRPPVPFRVVDDGVIDPAAGLRRMLGHGID